MKVAEPLQNLLIYKRGIQLYETHCYTMFQNLLIYNVSNLDYNVLKLTDILHKIFKQNLDTKITNRSYRLYMN